MALVYHSFIPSHRTQCPAIKSQTQTFASFGAHGNWVPDISGQCSSLSNKTSAYILRVSLISCDFYLFVNAYSWSSDVFVFWDWGLNSYFIKYRGKKMKHLVISSNPPHLPRGPSSSVPSHPPHLPLALFTSLLSPSLLFHPPHLPPPHKDEARKRRQERRVRDK